MDFWLLGQHLVHQVSVDDKFGVHIDGCLSWIQFYHVFPCDGKQMIVSGEGNQVRRVHLPKVMEQRVPFCAGRRLCQGSQRLCHFKVWLCTVIAPSDMPHIHGEEILEALQDPIVF